MKVNIFMEQNTEINLEETKKNLDDKLKELLKYKNFIIADTILEQAVKVFDEHKYHQLLTIIKQKLGKIAENDKLFPEICERYNNPDDWNNYSIHLKDKRKFVEAIIAAQKAIIINDKKAAYYCNQALPLTQINKHDIAIKKLNKAIELDPNQWYYHANKACCLADIGRYQESEISFKLALKHEECHKDVEVDYFYSLAFQKKYDLAWSHYEARYKCYSNLIKYMEINKLQKPEKLNKDMDFCVFMEQGIGDNLMFLRFVQEFQNEYKNSYFVANENFQLICKNLRVEKEIKPTTKYGISLLSLPYHMGIKEIPKPYKLGNYSYKKTIKRIGIVWAGNASHPMDYQRSCYAEDFLSQIDLDKYEVYSFQKDKRPRKYSYSDNIVDYSNNLEKYKIIDLSDKLESIEDTVGWLEKMDYFIGIDSLPIHIAGSVGIPSTVIVSDKPDWRWGKTESCSEWYPNIKICRKDKTRSFKNVIESCLSDLKAISG
jgi:tetratricopeptide (TPR) repeat protein